MVDVKLGMPDARIKEQISKAYATAISARVGIVCEFSENDYGTDGTFKQVQRYKRVDSDKEEISDTGIVINFQLKSTVNYQLKNEYIVYDLRAKNYRDLIRENGAYPKILVLYLMPREEDEWVAVNDCTTLQKCAWWCSLKGLPLSDNDNTVTIKIPLRNKLTPDELFRLMSIVAEGREVNDEC